MEGSLLDPESDTALVKDWNLPELPSGIPELPAGASSLPGTSQELAEIFGTSDDEDEDFPFNLNSYLTVGKELGDIGLSDSEPKRFDTSLLGGTDSGLFLSSIQESLGPSMEHLSEGGGIPEVKPSPKKETGSSTLNGSSGGGGEKIKSSKETNRPPEISSSPAVVANEEQPKTVLRKSVRLQGRQESEKKEGEEDQKRGIGKASKGKPTKGKSVSRPEGGTPSQSDKEEQQEEKASMKDRDKKGSTVEETNQKPKPHEEKMEVEDEMEEEGESEDEEDEESDDPDKLWCICREPHDDRFMICCDRCEEWYHGDCVGITVGQGKRMEREGKEYVCPVCVDQEKQNKELREAGRSARQARRELAKEKEKEKKPSLPDQSPISQTPTTHPKNPAHTHQRKRVPSTSSRSHPHTPSADSGDQYGLSQLFLPDNAQPSSNSGEELACTNEDEKNKVKEEPGAQCIGPGCSEPAPPPSVYCSSDCIEKHAAEMLKLLSNKGVSIQTSPSEFVRGSGGVSVLEKATGKVVMGIVAPSEKNLVTWLKTHPSYQVLLPAGKAPRNKATTKVKTEGKKEPESPTKLKPSLLDPVSVRANAKKALYQILWKRCEDAGDLQDTSQEEVEKIANEIEDRLYAIHQDITPRYKTKYRSLLFNLKDVKNQGLFRKVVLKQLSPRELVRMSSEMLASEELSQWREQTIKKNLEMIKVAEEEAQALAGTIRKKTYKGDVEIETDSQDKIETIPVSEKAAQKPPVTPTTPTTPTLTKTHPGTADSKSKPPTKPSSDSHSTADSKSHSHSKTTDSSKPGGGGVLDILTNTTSQHGSHVFDQHCDICTGKIPPPSPTSSSPHPTSVTADSSNPSPDSRTMDSEPMNTPRSPDSAAHSHHLESLSTQVVWKGTVNMTGLTSFATTAHPVSGPIEYLSEILPDTLNVMGRIAHVQVWDYVDKLRSSTSRDIVVLRFDMLEEDQASYLCMLKYLVRKHRCGVIGDCHHGIKDFYLVPLIEGEDVATQLLPFKGPGLPADHPDTLLGVIVRSKTRRPPKKRQHSVGDDISSSGLKKSRLHVEAEVGGHISPGSADTDRHDDEAKITASVTLSMSGGYPSQMTTGTSSSSVENPGVQKSMDEASSGGEAMDIETESSEDTNSQNIQMSFYGQHQPLSQTQSSSLPQVAPQEPKTTATCTPVSHDLPPPPGIQSILSQLSDEKLKELASAMSTLGQAAPPSKLTAGVTNPSTAKQPQPSQMQTGGGGGGGGGGAQLPPPPPGDQHHRHPTPQGQMPPGALAKGNQPPFSHPQAQQQQQQQVSQGSFVHPQARQQPLPPQQMPPQQMPPQQMPPQQMPPQQMPPQQMPPQQMSEGSFPHSQAPDSYSNYSQQPPPQQQQISQQGGYPPNQPGPTNLQGHHLQGHPQVHQQIHQQGHPQGHPLQDQQQMQASYPANQQPQYPPQVQQHGYNSHLQPYPNTNYPPHPPTDERNYSYNHPQGWGDPHGAYPYEMEGGGRYDNRYDNGYSKLDRIETRDYGHKSGPPSHDWQREERFRHNRPYEQGGYRERPRR